MSSNVGLSTPRGSGTSGYVQRNLSSLRPRDPTFSSPPSSQYHQRQPNAQILEHTRLRAIEVEVFDLRDRLEDEGVDEEEIEVRTEALRKKLIVLDEGGGGGVNGGGNGGGGDRGKKGLKSHQVHELAKAKIEESERLRRALGIREDYEEGSHWKRQEERLRDGVEGREGGGGGGVKREGMRERY